MYKLINVILFCLFLTSCLGGGKKSNPFYIKSITPSNTSVEVDAFQTVEIKFSQEIDQESLIQTSVDGVQTKMITVTETLSQNEVSGVDSVQGKTFTFTPNQNQPLKWSTSYTVTVLKNITNSDGSRTLDSDRVTTFTTADLPTPTLSGISHSGLNANSVRPIVLTFNFVPTDSTSYLQTAIEVRNVTTNQVVNGSIFVDGRTITFTPSNGYLAYNSTFQVSLVSSISGQSGRDSVILTPADVVTRSFSTPGPKLMSYTPTGTNIHPSPIALFNNRKVEIDLGFNFNYNQSSLNSSTVFLTDLSTGQNVATSVVNGTDPSTFSLVTVAPLKYNTRYQVTVTTGLFSSLGAEIRLPQNFSWNFTTQSMKVVSSSVSSTTFNPGDSIVIETNFDLDKVSSYLELTGYNKDDRSITIEANFENIQYDGSGQFSRKLIISSTQTSGLQYNQVVDIEYSLVDLTTGLFNEYDFTTAEIEPLTVSATNRSPYNSENFVDADETITFNFNGVSIENEYALEIELNPESFMRVTNCFEERIFGEVYINSTGTSIEFIPDSLFDSDCKYTVEIFSNTRLTDDFVTTSFSSWTFTTDNLEVDSISIDDSFSGVSIYTDIEVDFNAYIDTYDSFGIYLISEFGTTVPVSVSGFGGNITVSPIFALDYDTGYTLVIEYDAVESDEKFNLKFDFEYDFYTEYDPSLGDSSSANKRTTKAFTPSISAKVFTQVENLGEAVRSNSRRSK